MNIKPLGNRILVKIKKFEYKSKSGLILTEENEYFDNFAIILEKGNDIKDLNIGEFVIFNKEKSIEVRNNNEILYIVNLEDIYAKVVD